MTESQDYNQKRELIELYFKYNTTMEVENLAGLLSKNIVAYYPSRTIRGLDNYTMHVTGTFKE